LIDSGALGVPIFVQINAFECFDPKPSAPRSWLIKKGLGRKDLPSNIFSASNGAGPFILIVMRVGNPQHALNVFCYQSVLKM
jgi:hypothetical protein